ncbi:hypothetical protein F4554_005184 [Actinopolymorpha rutila]|uniref:Uncharacterized protein n=1 Tax=Actinopolymorpha rutila TaxID=446787 RepID=A0A852ZV12_9ACTN|nr:hypothetical protein [Actinopolymorpha rutila]NYH92546.1 hypothetical protein [Actinopolymorpha rutila]
MDHPIRAVQVEHRRPLSLVEGDQPVRVVLEEGEAVVGRQLHQPGALLRRERATGRVVEVRDHVDQADLVLRTGSLDRGRVDAVGLQWRAHELGAGLLKQKQCAVVGGLLDHDAIATGDEVAEEERRSFHRAVGDHHLLRVDAVSLGDPLAEPRVPSPCSIAERVLPVRLEGMRGRLTHGLVREDVGARRAASKADRPYGHWRSTLL